MSGTQVLIAFLLYIVPSMYFMYLTADIYMRNKDSSTNRFFAILLMCFAIQNVFQYLAYMLPQDSGILIYRWGTFPMSIVTLYVSVRFYLKVTKLECKIPRPLLHAFGYVPFVLVFVASVFTDSLIRGGYMDGAWVRPVKGYAYYYYNVYMLVMSFAGIVLLSIGLKRAQTAKEKGKFRKMLYLAAASMVIGFVTAAEAGLITHVKHGEIPELGLIASIFWGWSFQRVMASYNFFPYQLQIYEMLHRHSTFGIVITDAEGFIVQANPAGQALLDNADVLPKVNRITDMYPEPIRKRRLEEYKLRYEQRKVVKTQEAEMLCKNGDSLILEWENGFLDFDDQQLQVIIIRDITEQKANERKVAFLAYHDPLTGLANRARIYERIEQAIGRVHERKLPMFAVMLIDLDDFKLVNDRLGHHAGDRLLTHVADKLRGAVTERDTVARLGGDEFIVLLTSAYSEEAVRNTAERIIASFQSEAVRFPSQDIYISSSIGISSCPSDGQEVDTLLKAADIAMYHAKGSGKNRFKLFAAGMKVNTAGDA
ncbi:diguanylate cyclase domain-containing protein [Paenibacillus chartarius]|uniref:Diguanylate cyclase domain-containing protein n=1 Tax=Paenibacillus chartarius TaxID=747481 RepID=A0ABV6DF63_9BACL